MALCLAPTLEFENEDDATQLKFLALIHDIYQFTYQNEEHCSAYCWFRDLTDPRSVQGFEFYDNENALAVTHRGSRPYKKMRQFIAGLQETDPTLLKFPPLLLLTPVEGFVNNNGALHFEHQPCKLRVTTIRTATGLACHTAVAEERGNGDDKGPTSGLSTTLHFLFVECYSNEERYLTQQEQNYLCLVKLVDKFEASMAVTDCVEGFGFMRNKPY